MSAKLAEQAERYDDMAEYMKKVRLTPDILNIVAVLSYVSVFCSSEDWVSICWQEILRTDNSHSLPGQCLFTSQRFYGCHNAIIALGWPDLNHRVDGSQRGWNIRVDRRRCVGFRIGVRGQSGQKLKHWKTEKLTIWPRRRRVERRLSANVRITKLFLRSPGL